MQASPSTSAVIDEMMALPAKKFNAAPRAYGSHNFNL
jgi:hypothetical protein